MAPTEYVTNWTTQITFLMRMVKQGDKYGKDMALTHFQEEPLIEFYDTRHSFDMAPDGAILGQLVTRYRVNTLRHDIECRGPSAGLDMDGGVDSWKLDSGAMVDVADFIHTHA